MKRRINNFHKSKPIVQNVKTDSVNEGKAPKNLTLANDISDWNPGVSHEQVSEADGVANTFEEAIGGKDQKDQAGAAAAPTSYSQAVNRFLIVRGAQARYKENAQKWNEAKEKYLINTKELDTLKNDSIELQDEYDSYTSEIDYLQKELNNASAKGDDAMVAKVSTKMNSVVDRNQEMVTKYNGVSAQIDSVEKNLAQANTDLDDAAAKGKESTATLKAYAGDIPEVDVDMRDPRDSGVKDPIKGDPGIKDPITSPGDTVELDPGIKDPITSPGDTVELNPRPIFNPDKGESFEDLPYSDPTKTETIQKALKDAEPAQREQEAELQNPEKELLPRDAKTVVREFQPEDDMHEAVKAGGIGLDIIADGAQVEKKVQYWNFHECNSSPQVNYYTLVNLDANSYPSVWEDSLGDTYVRDSITESPMIGASDGTGLLYSGTYTGPSGVTCL